jgi:C4-dicarboxylate-specific signal transduction histidine kinase
LAHAEVVAKAAQYCHHLAENWRGASKEAQSFAPVDLPALVKEVLVVVLPSRDAVELLGVPMIKVLGSRFELMRVIQNLVKNAMECGATAIQVEIERIQRSVRLDVRDNGPGMTSFEIKKANGSPPSAGCTTSSPRRTCGCCTNCGCVEVTRVSPTAGDWSGSRSR